MKSNYNSKRKLSAAQISDIYDKVEMHVASQIIALVICTLEIITAGKVSGSKDLSAISMLLRDWHVKRISSAMKLIPMI